MTRYRFPADRSAFIYGQDFAPILTPPRTAVVVYQDQAMTEPADIQTLTGSTIALSTVYTVEGLIPEFLGPDGVSRLWAGVSGAPAYPLDAEASSLFSSSSASSALHASGIAAATLSGHRVVTPQPDGTLNYASNDNLSHVQAPLWITTGATDVGGTVDALMLGQMTEGSWTWSQGPVYLGANGLLTQTPPVSPAVFLAQVGTATTATSLFVDRGPSIKLT
jgi:hypothetical protein